MAYFVALQQNEYLPVYLACSAAFIARGITLARYSDLLPEKAREVGDVMRKHDWLGSYRNVESVGQAIDRMAVYRLKRANTLGGGIEEFLADPGGFSTDFRQFLPDALAFAADWRAARES